MSLPVGTSRDYFTVQTEHVCSTPEAMSIQIQPTHRVKEDLTATVQGYSVIKVYSYVYT